MKQLVFNVTSDNTIADSDSVGAYLRASDGTLLTHSDVGGKKALDVSIADGVNLEVDLSHVDDSVRLGDGTDFFTSTTVGADVGLDVNLINASIVVTATDLDIRDLSNLTDSVTAHQGGTWVIDSITNPVTVQATDLDIRDLSAASDSVQSNLFDGAGNALTSTLVGSDQALDVFIANEISVNDAALANTALANDAKTLAVADTAEVAVTTALSNRKYVYVRNEDSRNIFIGSATVSAANGFPIPPKAMAELRLGAAVDLYYVGSAGSTPEIRTLELA